MNQFRPEPWTARGHPKAKLPDPNARPTLHQTRAVYSTVYQWMISSFPINATRPSPACWIRYGIGALLRYLACTGDAPLPAEKDKPDFSVLMRLGGRDMDELVRKHSSVLVARAALVGMVTQVETHLRNLLLQKRTLEKLAPTNSRMNGKEFLALQRSVAASTRGMLDTCSKLVTNPSVELKGRLKWLDGVNRIRNCLAHNGGIVSLVDVKKPGTSIEDVKETDVLEVVWEEPRYFDNDGEILDFKPGYVTKAPGFRVALAEKNRNWKLGEHIDVEPADVNFIGNSLSKFALQLQAEYLAEMEAFLAPYAPVGPSP